MPSVGQLHLPVEVLLDNLQTLAAASDRLRGGFDHHPYHEIGYEDSRDDIGPGMPSMPDRKESMSSNQAALRACREAAAYTVRT